MLKEALFAVAASREPKMDRVRPAMLEGLCSEGVFDFDHVDGSSDLSREERNPHDNTPPLGHTQDGCERQTCKMLSNSAGSTSLAITKQPLTT